MKPDLILPCLLAAALWSGCAKEEKKADEAPSAMCRTVIE